MPSQSRSSVQRTHSLPVHSSPQAILMFPPGKVPQLLGLCLRNTLSWPFSSLLGLIRSSTSPHTSHHSAPISLQSGFSCTLPHPHFSLLSQVLPSFSSSPSCVSTSLPSYVVILVYMLVSVTISLAGVEGIRESKHSNGGESCLSVHRHSFRSQATRQEPIDFSSWVRFYARGCLKFSLCSQGQPRNGRSE